MTADKINKKVLFLLALIIFLLIGAIVVEAALSDKVKSYKSKFSKFKTNMLTKERLVNYVILTIVLIVASLFFLKDKMGDDKTKYMIWIACFILGMVIAVNWTAPDQYIWEKDFIQDAKHYAFGDAKLQNAQCDGSGAYLDQRPGINRCRQGILRTNNGKGLPAFVVAIIIAIMLLGKYKEALGLTNNKLKYAIAVVLAAIVSNGGTEKEHLITMGGWILVFMMYGSFKAKMPEKAGTAAGIAYGAVETLANLFGTTLLWGTAPAAVSGMVLLKNFAFGAIIGIIYNNAFGKEGVVSYALDNMKKKRKEQIKELIDNGHIAKGFAKALPIVGNLVPADDEETEKWSEVKDKMFSIGKPSTWFSWWKKKKAKDDEAAKITKNLKKAREFAEKEFNELFKKHKSSFAPGREPDFEAIMKGLGKLDADDLSGSEGSEKVKKVLKEIISDPITDPTTKSKIETEFVEVFENILWKGHKKKDKYDPKLSYLQYLIAEKKLDKGEDAEPQLTAKDLTEENIKDKEDKIRKNLKDAYKKFKRDYDNLAKKNKYTAAQEIDRVIRRFDDEIDFKKLKPDELAQVVPTLTNCSLFGKQSADQELASKLQELWSTLINMFDDYINQMNYLHGDVNEAIHDAFNNLGAHNYKEMDWEQVKKVIKGERESLIPELAEKILVAANNFRVSRKGDPALGYVIAEDRLLDEPTAKDRAEKLNSSLGRDGWVRSLLNVFKSDMDMSYINLYLDRGPTTENLKSAIKERESRLSELESHQKDYVDKKGAKDPDLDRKMKAVEDELTELKKDMDKIEKQKKPGMDRDNLLSDYLTLTFASLNSINTKYQRIANKERELRRQKFIYDTPDTNQTKTCRLVPSEEDAIFIEREDVIVDDIVLSKKAIYLGSEEKSDIVIEDSSGNVANDHATLILVGDGVFKMYPHHDDKFVYRNGALLDKGGEMLKDGDRIKIGPTDFEFEFKVTSKVDEEWKQYRVFAIEKISAEEQKKYDDNQKDSSGVLDFIRSLESLGFTGGLKSDGSKPKFKEAKKAYRKKAAELHPDKTKGDATKEEEFKKVSAAWPFIRKNESAYKKWSGETV